jgi:hypothetical protein
MKRFSLCESVGSTGKTPATYVTERRTKMIGYANKRGFKTPMPTAKTMRKYHKALAWLDKHGI